jgi:carboxymethylenebutenolidase
MVTFAGNGVQAAGYFARSASGFGPGVIVIQEWWGLVGHIKDVADRFASEGFTALAPDLYKGESTTEPDEAGSLMMALDVPETEKTLRYAVIKLLNDPATIGDRVGVVGFCMGGQLAMFAATTNPAIGACANFYGIHPNVQPDYARLTCPLIGFFAEHDDYASAEAVEKLEQALTSAGKDYSFKTYAGAHHAFFNSDRPQVYDRNAAEDAWKRMVSFFRTELT